MFVVGALNFPIALWRNHRFGTRLFDLGDDSVAVVSLVGNDVFHGEVFQQRFGLSDVVRLSRRQRKLNGVAERVARRVNLRAEAAARTSELLFAVFFRAPAA